MRLIFTDEARNTILAKGGCIQVLPVRVGCTHCGTVHIPQVIIGQPKPEAVGAYEIERVGDISAYLHRDLEDGTWRVDIAGWGRWKSLFLEKTEG